MLDDPLRRIVENRLVAVGFMYVIAEILVDLAWRREPLLEILGEIPVVPVECILDLHSRRWRKRTHPLFHEGAEHEVAGKGLVRLIRDDCPRIETLDRSWDIARHLSVLDGTPCQRE